MYVKFGPPARVKKKQTKYINVFNKSPKNEYLKKCEI